ncbi:hypothetical protein [Caballeronia sp. GAFFF1]|uniref:hypothetical protein n=1 Tax=Caballeronia sp. GAFFF1 TaxID=2921779 RepID=UPI002028C02E|nr:hypothetical protein [Caballeronia sp. GAFFF1]
MTNAKENAGELPSFSPTSPARTKMGRLRELFDEVEAAKLAGFRHEHIIASLKAQQLDVSFDTLKDALKKIRAERRAGKMSKTAAPKKEVTQKSESVAQDKQQQPERRKVSASGYREEPLTFKRDITKRINLDE